MILGVFLHSYLNSLFVAARFRFLHRWTPLDSAVASSRLPLPRLQLQTWRRRTGRRTNCTRGIRCRATRDPFRHGRNGAKPASSGSCTEAERVLGIDHHGPIVVDHGGRVFGGVFSHDTALEYRANLVGDDFQFGEIEAQALRHIAARRSLRSPFTPMVNESGRGSRRRGKEEGKLEL